MNFLPLIYALLAGIGAGFVNALAGGGTLITFPVLTALGLPPVIANVTSTIALVPGLLGGIYGQRKEFNENKPLIKRIAPIAILGAIGGSILLLHSSEQFFSASVPFLIAGASILLLVSPLVKRIVARRSASAHTHSGSRVILIICLLPAAVYGGYFGAGLGIILLALLGFLMDASMATVNAVKQAVSLCVNICAALYFCFWGNPDWALAGAVAAGALSGGWLGGLIAKKLPSGLFRWIVGGYGLAIAGWYLFR